MSAQKGTVSDLFATRPDYVRCVSLGIPPKSDDGKQVNKDGDLTWCGRWHGPWDKCPETGSALLGARGGGYLLICPECAAAMVKAIERGTAESGCARQPEDEDEDDLYRNRERED
jgi:hypothetical protein